ncbi:MAG: RNA methyltransferase [Lentisphaerales bacterium]|nr:RNA methyltransferase [Lentisphaerales bacterium]
MAQKLPNSLEKEIKKYKTRQGRKKASFYVVEGERCCDEAILAGVEIKFAVLTEKGLARLRGLPDCPLYSVSDKEFESLSQTENGQGVMFIVEKTPILKPLYSDPYILVLDGLQEPGNVGTILRTALAVGLKEVVLTKGTADPYNPKVVRSGMGAHFKLRICHVESLKEIKESLTGSLWLTTPRDGVSCYDESFELSDGALVFGEEGNGIADFSLGEKVTIPMPGNAESLNVAQAATVFLFEGVRRGLL